MSQSTESKGLQAKVHIAWNLSAFNIRNIQVAPGIQSTIKLSQSLKVSQVQTPSIMSSTPIQNQSGLSDPVQAILNGAEGWNDTEQSGQNPQSGLVCNDGGMCCIGDATAVVTVLRVVIVVIAVIVGVAEQG